MRLLIVDAMAVIYRAFYAIRDLSTAAGVPTNAVYGFIRMLRQLKEVWAPTHLLVIFDGGKPEERLDLLKDYKANRAPMPDALKSQLPLIVEYLDCAGIPWVRHEAQEADDLIASIVAQAEASTEADDILIATSDKDMYQMVNERIKIVSVSGKQQMMGAAEVKEKTGVLPEGIVDWLALVGDASDNIPGVPGVGPKTAANLLQQYGSIDGIWEHLNDVEREKLRISLTEHRDDVLRNIKVVTLRTDLDCGIQIEDIKVSVGQSAALFKFYSGLEFHSLARELAEPELF